MKLNFYKYQGAGNDFILFDDRDSIFPKDEVSLIQKLCDRRFGIGSDGILLIQKSKRADIYLDFINPDGSRSFCGNGSRCGIRFAEHLGLISGQCTFDAIDGLHTATLSEEKISISMIDVESVIAEEGGIRMNTGSPHLVISVDRVGEVEVKEKGAAIRYNKRYRESGINVNFVESVADDLIKIRTYERGVEDETLSCGTGVTAAVLAQAWKMKTPKAEMRVLTEGGELSVTYKRTDRGYEDVTLRGPAVMVFQGLVEL